MIYHFQHIYFLFKQDIISVIQIVPFNTGMICDRYKNTEYREILTPPGAPSSQ